MLQVDTDKADDLFLCGTDVAGSCLAVSAEEGFNPALMGYVLDGKYRMLAVQSDEGVTQARRMMRLLLDEQTGKPVLSVEKLYANAGFNAGGTGDQALLALAHAKGAALGCPVLCAKDTNLASESYPHAMVSLGNPAPLEFMDAGEDYLPDGSYTMAACHVRNLKNSA